MKLALLVLVAAAACSAAKPTGLAAASDRLGYRLHSLLPRSTAPNVFYSPYSLSAAMGMLYAGAKGKTREELYTALNYKSANIAKDNVLREHKAHTDRLLATSKSTVSAANAAAIQEHIKVVPAYLAALNESFGARVLSVNFEKNAKAALNTINKWVEQETHGHIKELIEKPPSAATKMVLLNAVYFKGFWKTEFNKSDTKKLPFFNDGTKSTLVQTMSGVFEASHGESKELAAEILSLPYKDGDYRMAIILPRDRNGIDKLRKASHESFESALHNLNKKLVNVQLPRLKLEAKYLLKDAFTKLGLPSVFDPRTADLSGIAGKNGDLYVGDVIHKAVVEVDETGSTAAAATGTTVLGSTGIEPHNFKADHPFVFLIASKENGVLFTGEVNRL